MNIHENARLTPQGRALMVKRILNEGWRVADAAGAAGVSERTAYNGWGAIAPAARRRCTTASLFRRAARTACRPNGPPGSSGCGVSA